MSVEAKEMTYPTRRCHFDATQWENQALSRCLRTHFAMQVGFGSKEIAHQNQETTDNDGLVCISTKQIIRRSTIKSVTQPELSTDEFDMRIPGHQRIDGNYQYDSYIIPLKLRFIIVS